MSDEAQNHDLHSDFFDPQLDDDDFFNLVLPTPFVSGIRPPSAIAEPPMPEPTPGVIDLTESPPMQVNRNEVIDLDALPDPVAVPTPVRRPHRTRRVPPLLRPANNVPTLPAIQQNPGPRIDWLQQQIDNRARLRAVQEMERVDPRQPRQPPPPTTSAGINSLLRNLVGSDMGNTFRAYLRGPNGGGPITYNSGSSLFNLAPQFFPPQPDYGLFNPGYGPAWSSSPDPPIPKYTPPEPCKEPFTRTFTESDILICSMCHSELGSGDESKRRLFITKCSHLYCGDCGLQAKSLAKGKGMKCTAPGCGKGVPKTRIFEAYV